MLGRVMQDPVVLDIMLPEMIKSIEPDILVISLDYTNMEHRGETIYIYYIYALSTSFFRRQKN